MSGSLLDDVSVRRSSPPTPTAPRHAGPTGPVALLMVVPTYNEAPNIAPLMGRLAAARSRTPFDVLVVDDGSPDGTAVLVAQLMRRHSWLNLMSRAAPTGLGDAYRAGFAWALERGYDLVGEMDADLSHDPAAIPSLYRAVVSGADLALGSRYVPGGGIRGWPLHRHVVSRAANLFARSVLRLETHDVTAGFRIYRRRVIRLLLEGTGQCGGYGFQVEGVYGVERAGLRIAEVPITFRERQHGSSKISRRVAVEAARRCLALALWDMPITLPADEIDTSPVVAPAAGA